MRNAAVSKRRAENTDSRQVERVFIQIADWKWRNGGAGVVHKAVVEHDPMLSYRRSFEPTARLIPPARPQMIIARIV